MFMCVVNLKSVNKLDLTWKQSFLILGKFFICYNNCLEGPEHNCKNGAFVHRNVLKYSSNQGTRDIVGERKV